MIDIKRFLPPCNSPWLGQCHSSSWHYYYCRTWWPSLTKSPGPQAASATRTKLNQSSNRRRHNWNNLIIRISSNLYPGTDSNDETCQASDWLTSRHSGLLLADLKHSSSGSLRVFLIMFDRCDELLGPGYYHARGLSYLVTTTHSSQNTQLSAEKLMNTGPGLSAKVPE